MNISDEAKDRLFGEKIIDPKEKKLEVGISSTKQNKPKEKIKIQENIMLEISSKSTSHMLQK